MTHSFRFIRDSIACGLLLAATIACAQSGTEPPSGDTASGPGTAPIVVDKAEPDTYYVKDAKGNLVPLLKLSFDRISRMMSQETGPVEPELPRYSLEQLSIRGRVDGSVARLTVTFRVRLENDEWTRIPLRFENAFLRSLPQTDDSAEAFFRYEADGYACWMRSRTLPVQPGTPADTTNAHTLTAGEETMPDGPPKAAPGSEAERGAEAGGTGAASPMSPPLRVLPAPVARKVECTAEFVVRLKRFGAETRLDLPIPRFAISDFELVIPNGNVTATVSDGSMDVFHEDGDSRLFIVGAAGDLRVTWREGDLMPRDQRPVLEVSAATLVRVEGLRQVSSDVDLEVRSLRGEFDTITIHLPEETRLLPRQFLNSGMRITELPTGEGQTGKSVEVKLERPTAGPVMIQLLAELAPRNELQPASGSKSPSPEYEVGGIEVEDAVRQFGTIDFAVQGDWSLNWMAGADVYRVPVPDSLRSTVAARFTHSRRAFSLRVQVARKETQISVDPQYLLFIEPDRVRLEATLNYRLRGRELYGVEVDLPDWTISEVLPSTLVNKETLDLSKNAPLSIPLQASALSEIDQFSLRIVATRDITDSNGLTVFSLPRPWANVVAPAVVAVLPADNAELTLGDCQGLQRENQPQKIDLPNGQRDPLFFRGSGGVEASVFAAKVTKRERAITVSASNTIRLDETRYRVEQTLAYRINYEPLKTLLFDVDSMILESGTLKILHNGQVLPPTVPEQGEDSASPLPADSPAEGDTVLQAPATRIQIDLVNEQIGECEIHLQYEGKLPPLPNAGGLGFAVPLVTPARGTDTTMTECSLRLVANGSVNASVVDELWEAEETLDPQVNSIGEYQADSLPSSVQLQLSGLGERTTGPTVVVQAWLQSWVGEEVRRERAVYRVFSEQPYLDVTLPQQATLERVAVDGVAWTATAPDPEIPSCQRIALPSRNDDTSHVLEFWYTLPFRSGLLSSIPLQAPKLAGAERLQRFYWQLAMPPDKHLLLHSKNMTEESRWRSAGMFWGRKPTLDETQLEQWIGATRQERLPGSANRYLFSSIGGIPHSVCIRAARPSIVLTLSGVTLILGLALIYLPTVRHPAMLFLIGVGLATLVLAYPQLAVPGLQASAMGIALAGLAVILKRMSDLHELRRMVIRSTPIAGPDSNTVRLVVQQQEGGSKGSTATLPGYDSPSAEGSPT